MLPGPDQIVACPHCKGLAKYMTLMSGNTFGACVWTDGKQVAPMLPQPPAIVICRHCAECYWLTDAKEIGSVEPWGSEGQQVNPEWGAALEVQEPTPEEYELALKKGLAADAQQERNVRVWAWWRGNEAYRSDAPKQAGGIANVTGAFRKNLQALVRLLDEEDETDALMKAEALRELGEFESAKQVLGRVTSDEFSAVVHQLRSLCNAGDTCVRELQFED